jgi:hypothetical protein
MIDYNCHEGDLYPRKGARLYGYLYLWVVFLMHMADALLSPAVGVTMCAVSAGAVAYSAAKVKKD